MTRRVTLIVSLAVMAAAGTARADADEASLDAEAIGGVARLHDELADATSSGPLVGIGARFSFARSNLVQWEARASFVTASAAYAGQEVTVGGVPRRGDLARRTSALRLVGGATARFGVRFVPTLQLGLGAQARLRATGTIDTVSVDEGSGAGVDLLATGAVGFDYRFGPRTVVGLSLRASYAVPLGGPAYQSVEGGLRFAHYWYPRW